MSSPDPGAVPPVDPANPTDPAAAAQAAAQNPSAPATLTAASTVSSMADFKAKAPELYNAMMQGIATNIINESQHASDRLKDIIRQGTADAEGRS